MSQFHKIWIEVDVLKETQKKTEMMTKIMTALMKVECVENITKIQYQIPDNQDAD